MTVRPAVPADAAGIARLWNTVIRDTLITFNSVEKSETEIATMIADGSAPVFVATLGDRIAGFATYAQFRAGAGYVKTMEHSIYLDETARGHGLGRALMTAVETDATARGVHSLIAGVSSANPAGRSFHTAMGFVEIATLPEVGFKWDQWLDLHLMQKRL